MARRLKILATLAAALMLTACFPLSPERDAAPSAPSLDLPPIEFTGELEPGACLMLDYQGRPDRDSVVPCTESHRFDVVLVDEWPELDGALEVRGADALWYSLASSTPADDDALSYRTWAERSCSAAFLDLIGWRRVMVDGIASEFLTLRPAGPFELDDSLASREEFTTGDHRTVCSVAWRTPIIFPEGVSIERLTTSGMPISARECVSYPDDSEWGEFVTCGEPHDSQTILWFDARAALGDEAVHPPEQYSQRDYDALGAFCEKTIDVAFHGGDRDFYAWGEPDYVRPWRFDASGVPIDGEPYAVACSVLRYDGRPFAGDVFEAVARRPAGGGN